MSEPTETLRQHLHVVLGEATTLAAVRQIVHDALGSEKATKVECPECGTMFRAKQPDLKKAVDTMIGLMEQTEGRPNLAAPEGTIVEIHRPPLG